MKLISDVDRSSSQAHGFLGGICWHYHLDDLLLCSWTVDPGNVSRGAWASVQYHPPSWDALQQRACYDENNKGKRGPEQ